MKSPFPGMDPYMERRWRGTHKALIVYAGDVINESLGDSDLRAEIDERVVVDSPDVSPRDIYPDVYLLKRGQNGRFHDSAGGAAVAEPLVVAVEEARPEPFLTIVDPRGGAVVTVIEFVSPANKFAGPNRRQYARKRREAAAADINFVEIDLTRAGRRSLPLEVARVPQAQEVTYLAWARRGFGRRVYEVYPMPLREPLPTIRLPLRRGDDDLPLPMQALVDRVHEKARYRPGDYAEPLRPRPRKADAAWVTERLAAEGLPPPGGEA